MGRWVDERETRSHKPERGNPGLEGWCADRNKEMFIGRSAQRQPSPLRRAVSAALIMHQAPPITPLSTDLTVNTTVLLRDPEITVS